MIESIWRFMGLANNLYASWPVVTAAFTVLAILILWMLFISVMTIKQRLERERARTGRKRWLVIGACYVFGYTLLLPGLLWDIFVNVVLGRWIFPGDARRISEWTLTSRLQRLIEGPSSANRARAIFICTHFVEPWDQDHCGLMKIGIVVKKRAR